MLIFRSNSFLPHSELDDVERCTVAEVFVSLPWEINVYWRAFFHVRKWFSGVFLLFFRQTSVFDCSLAKVFKFSRSGGSLHVPHEFGPTIIPRNQHGIIPHFLICLVSVRSWRWSTKGFRGKGKRFLDFNHWFELQSSVPAFLRIRFPISFFITEYFSIVTGFESVFGGKLLWNHTF